VPASEPASGPQEHLRSQIPLAKARKPVSIDGDVPLASRGIIWRSRGSRHGPCSRPLGRGAMGGIHASRSHIRAQAVRFVDQVNRAWSVPFLCDSTASDLAVQEYTV
jgi:hypothetical protein